MDSPFRRRLFGFSKKDVVRYITEMDCEHHEALSEAEKRCERLSEIIDTQSKQLKDCENSISVLNGIIANAHAADTSKNEKINSLVAEISSQSRDIHIMKIQNGALSSKLSELTDKLSTIDAEAASKSAESTIKRAREHSLELLAAATELKESSGKNFEALTDEFDRIKNELKTVYESAESQIEDIANCLRLEMQENANEIRNAEQTEITPVSPKTESHKSNSSAELIRIHRKKKKQNGFLRNFL